jgi:type IV secretory pathway TraG/TraD family ATPase VirD4
MGVYMKNYFEEMKSFYNFVSSNFTYYKKRKMKKRTQAVMPENKLKTKVEEKAKNKTQKRKAKVAHIRKVS